MYVAEQVIEVIATILKKHFSFHCLKNITINLSNANNKMIDIMNPVSRKQYVNPFKDIIKIAQMLILSACII